MLKICENRQKHTFLSAYIIRTYVRYAIYKSIINEFINFLETLYIIYITYITDFKYKFVSTKGSVSIL